MKNERRENSKNPPHKSSTPCGWWLAVAPSWRPLFILFINLFFFSSLTHTLTHTHTHTHTHECVTLVVGPGGGDADRFVGGPNGCVGSLPLPSDEVLQPLLLCSVNLLRPESNHNQITVSLFRFVLF